MQERDCAVVIQFGKCERNVRKTRPAIAKFEDGKSQAKEYRWTRQGNIFSPKSSKKECCLADILIFNH